MPGGCSSELKKSMQFVSGVQRVWRQCANTESALIPRPSAAQSGNGHGYGFGDFQRGRRGFDPRPGCDIARSCSAFFRAS